MPRSPRRAAPARSRQGKPRQGKPWLAWAGYAGLALTCVVLVVATFLVVVAPVDLIRDRIAYEVKLHTGRDLVVSGPTSLRLLPRPAITLTDVALSAPADMGGDPMLTTRTLQAEVQLMSLLTGRPEVRRLVLTQPVIVLAVDAQGRRSWDVGSGRRHRAAAGPGEASAASAAEPAQGGRRAPTVAAALGSLSAATVHVVGGTIRYADERSGTRRDIGGLAADLAVAEGAGPVDFRGSVEWQGERLAFTGTLSELRTFLEERNAQLSLRLTGQPLVMSYEGTVGGDKPALDGNVRLEAPSVDGLGTLIGQPIAAGRDAGPFSLSSAVSGDADRLSLSDLRASLGGTSLSGALAVERGSARPHVSGSLRISQLDLGGMLVRPAAPAEGSPAKGTQVRGFTRRAGAGADWSDDVIDLAPLGLIDADVSVAADGLVYKDIKTGPTRLVLQLKDRVARLTLEDIALYGGRGHGLLGLDGSAQVPATTANLELAGVAAQPLLKDALGFDWLEGHATISLALAGQGVSERRIVETLRGRASLTTANGAIDAVDVDKLVRSLAEGSFSGLKAAAGDKTAFKELAATFTITDGIARNDDLRLTSSNLRVTGSGSFNLAARTLDYTVRPKLAVSSTSERAVINVANLEVPVRIEGPWDKPSVGLVGQEQIGEAVKEIGKALKSQDVQDAIKGLLGGGDGQQKVKPREILEKLFKKP